MSDLNSRVRKLAYMVPGEGGGAPLELFDPHDITDLITTEIIAELERIEGEGFSYKDTDFAIQLKGMNMARRLQKRLSELKAKETQL